MGATGPTGPTGPPGSGTGGGMSWVDAQGVVVGAAIDPWQAEYVDAQGMIWAVHHDTAELGPYVPRAAVYYSGAGCTGTAYLGQDGLAPPRMVVATYPDPTPKVRPDDAVASHVTVASIQGSEGGCSGYNSETDGVPLSLFRTVTLPSVSFTGPLHRERR